MRRKENKTGILGRFYASICSEISNCFWKHFATFAIEVWNPKSGEVSWEGTAWPAFWSFIINSNVIFRGIGVHMDLLKAGVSEQEGERAACPSGEAVLSALLRQLWTFCSCFFGGEGKRNVWDELWWKWEEVLPAPRWKTLAAAFGQQGLLLTSQFLQGWLPLDHTISF